MRACKNLLIPKKRSKEEMKVRIMHLQKEVSKLEEIICELDRRVTHLELMRKLGN